MFETLPINTDFPNDGQSTYVELLGIAKDLMAVAIRLSTQIDGLTLDEGSSGRFALSGRRDKSANEILIKLAKSIYRDRRKREAFFSHDLLGEPAWDILLDLFVASLEGKLVSVTSACIGAAVPPTTALRWLTVLDQEGLVERSDCKDDKRRNHIMLTDLGFAKMKEYLQNTELGFQNRLPVCRNSGENSAFSF